MLLDVLMQALKQMAEMIVYSFDHFGYSLNQIVPMALRSKLGKAVEDKQKVEKEEKLEKLVVEAFALKMMIFGNFTLRIAWA